MKNPDKEDFPVIRLVGCMLIDAVKSSKEELSFSIDSPPEFRVDSRNFIPDKEITRKMINRLKVMSKLSPMKYSEPTSGEILLKIAGKNYKAQSKFTDTKENHACELRIVNI